MDISCVNEVDVAPFKLSQVHFGRFRHVRLFSFRYSGRIGSSKCAQQRCSRYTQKETANHV